MKHGDALKQTEVPPEVAAHLALAVKSWRAAAASLAAYVDGLDDLRRQAELRRLIRGLNSQALMLEQLVIASPTI